MSLLDKFWVQLEKGQVVRRIAFFGMMYLTWITYQWVFAYISSLGLGGLEGGILVGAILGPVSALQAAVIKFYADNPYKPNVMIDVKPKKEEDE